MSNELTMVNNNFPSQIELQSISLIARTAHASGLYGGVGGEAKIMMILLAAKELGVGPCQALNGGIWSIQGKIEISARLMNGLIRRAGHSIKIVESSDTKCTLLGTRTDGDSFECSFTIEDAIKAGLAKGNVWLKYPADMLYNRCMSRLGRRLFSDVIGQCYIEGEIREAKEVETFAQAEYEDLTNSQVKSEKTAKLSDNPGKQHLTNDTKTSQCDTESVSCQNVPKSTESVEEPKVSEEQLNTLIELFKLTDTKCQENCMELIRNEYKTAKFKDLPERSFEPLKHMMGLNIEFNVKKGAS